MKSLNYNQPLPQLASQYTCTGCMACLNCCPVQAIQSYEGDDGHRYVKIDSDKCIRCKKCEKVCSLSLKNYGENNIHKSKVYAAWNTDPLERRKSTSGGIFSAVARKVIEDKGVVIGATLDDRVCKHILIRNIEDINIIQGSKYIESSMGEIYKEIEKELENKKVLFSGVGCQCAGILAYFDNHKFKNNLITIDLVCGGVPSKILLDKFYENNPNVKRIVSFRDKDKYQLKVEENKRVIEIKKKNLPLNGFNCDMTNRYSCYNCQFACIHRKTDLTIGDLWNYDVYKEEHEKGISTLIIHSESGKKIIETSSLEYHEINWSDCLKSCRRIACGKSHIFSPRYNLIENSKKMSYDDFVELYCITMKPKNCFLFLFRIYRFILNKFLFFKIDHKINKFLKKNKRENI